MHHVCVAPSAEKRERSTIPPRATVRSGPGLVIETGVVPQPLPASPYRVKDAPCAGGAAMNGSPARTTMAVSPATIAPRRLLLPRNSATVPIKIVADGGRYLTIRPASGNGKHKRGPAFPAADGLSLPVFRPRDPLRRRTHDGGRRLWGNLSD